jgi:glycosyltransferase involved in cell wall biosynthesis
MRADKARRGRIALFYPYGAFSTVAGLLDATRILSDRGYEVEVYYRGTPDFIPDRLKYPGVTVTDDKPAVFSKGPVRCPRVLRRWSGSYSHLISAGPHRWWRQRVFLPELRRRHQRLPYVCFMGVDWHGLTAAGPLAADLGVPLAYWSLELMFRDDLPDAGWKDFKEEEAAWSRNAAFVIIQDAWRAAALIDEDGVDPARIVLVPNAPRGRARRSPNDLLRKRYNIAPSRRVAICSGFLQPWAMSLEIVEAARDWPGDYLLYMQSKVTRQHDTTGYSASVVRAVNPDSTVLNLDPLPAEQYGKFVDSADVGLALYNPRFRENGRLDRNMELMGYSSGKLADYLHRGLPVIVNDLPGLRDLVRQYACGVCVTDARQTGEALDTIFRDYEQYSLNACRCFDEALELERHFEAVVERLALLEAKL